MCVYFKSNFSDGIEILRKGHRSAAAQWLKFESQGSHLSMLRTKKSVGKQCIVFWQNVGLCSWRQCFWLTICQLILLIRLYRKLLLVYVMSLNWIKIYCRRCARQMKTLRNWERLACPSPLYPQVYVYWHLSALLCCLICCLMPAVSSHTQQPTFNLFPYTAAQQTDKEGLPIEHNWSERLQSRVTSSDGNNGVKINGVTNGVIFFSNG